MKLASIDFEYYDTAEAKLNIVCSVIRHDNVVKKIWTHGNPEAQEECLSYINMLSKEGYIFLAYNVVAEASSVISLGGSPLSIKWIDNYLEYRCLSNHNDNYAYGKQLIKGRKTFTKRPLPKWQRTTEEDEKKAESQKQEYGYGAAVYKTLGIVIDSEFKKEIRDLIIACNSGDEDKIQAMVDRKDDILTYCASDTEHLEPMFDRMVLEYKRLLGRKFDIKTLIPEMYNRSKYSVRTAIMERLGYPIDYEKTKNFSSQVGNIIWECQVDINRNLKLPIFRAKSKKKPFDLSWDQKLTRDELRKWIKDSGFKGWTLTDGGKKKIKDLSLSLKAFQKPISYRHSYPEGNFIAQMQRYLKLKQGLNGFVQSDKGKSFWNNVGRDGRVRPYMGIYGAQSARSQPSASGFIPLKAAWMRSLIQAPSGRAICGIDFASQEFLLAALLSGDEEMLKAYESGDVYLAFGKSIGYIPKDGTRATHKKERDECKAVVLGLSYDMSEYGLAIDLSEKFGRRVTPEEALKWIEKHKKAYKKFWAWKVKLLRDYRNYRYIKLPDGWYMWGDNDNFRSVGNVPIQGFGSCIMRKAVELAQEGGLDVIYTLHDAIYIEFDSGNCHESVRILAECMDKAFRFYFDKKTYCKATVRLDADIWGNQFSNMVDDSTINYTGADGKVYGLNAKYQGVYIDERSIDDYKKFSKYFEKEDLGELVF